MWMCLLQVMGWSVVGISSAHAQDAFTFVVVGDTQTDGDDYYSTYAPWSINWSVFPNIIDDMNTHDPSVGLFAGDLVGGSSSLMDTRAQWQDFKDVALGLNGEVLPVVGNHDVYAGLGTFSAFEDEFDWLPNDDSPANQEGVSYYYDYGNTRFIAITSDLQVAPWTGFTRPSLNWLDRVLEEAAGMEHTFVFTHHPITFSTETYVGGTEDEFWQILVNHEVTGLFAGHWHRYQPSQPGGGANTWETIIGTGGGWIGFDPIRPYQQMHGFLAVEIDGANATASFYADVDDDGYYDDLMDSYVMASEDPSPVGLVGRYSFEDGVITNTAPPPLGRDLSGQLFGGASLSGGGIDGDALRLTGEADYALVGGIDDYTLAINGDLTVSAWAFLDGLRDGTWANVLLCYGTNDYYLEDEETNYTYWLSATDDRRLMMYWEYLDGYNANIYSTETVDDLLDTWHHFAVTRDMATQQVRFFVDGVQLGEPVPFDTNPSGGGRGMLYFGSDTEAFVGDGHEMDGWLDEVCIYNTPLTDAAISALAARTDCVEALSATTPTTTTTTPTTTTTTTTTPTTTTTTTTTHDTGETSEPTGTGTETTSTTRPVDTGLPTEDKSDEPEPLGCGCGHRSGGYPPFDPLLISLTLLGMCARRRR
jgi:hypothetical protein